VHDTVVLPLVAVIVMVSPLVPPVALIVGVVSLVLLSVLDDPESDDASKSTPDGADGGVVSIEMGSALDDGDVFPAGSVSVDEMFQFPGVNVGSVQSVDVPTTYEHDTVVLPLLAEMVMVSPLVPPVALTVGVVSLVLLSVDDEPVSDAVTRSTPLGAFGGVVSSVTEFAVEEAPGPDAPAEVVIDPLASVGATVPSLHPVTEMVNDDTVPDDGETVNTHPVALPELEKSSAVNVDASIVAEKESE